jgi:anti-sigma B factor antagonist
MEIAVSHHGDQAPVTVLRIRGEITLESYQELQRRAEDEVRAGASNLVLDLTEVTFVSSSGLRAIHYIFDLLRTDVVKESDKAVREGVRQGTFTSPHLKLLNPKDQVLGTLRQAGYDMFLEIHSSQQQALASF